MDRGAWQAMWGRKESVERKGHLGEFLDPESSIVCQA